MRAKRVDDEAIGPRMKALLKALDLKQHDVANTAAEHGHKLTRNDVNKACTGLNKLTTAKMRNGIADGVAMSRADFDDYIDGRVPLEDVLRRRVAKRATSSPGDELTFGQIDGWDEAERGALRMAATTKSTLTQVDFAGTRRWKAFGLPRELNAEFVFTVAWLWSQVATSEMRTLAEADLAKRTPLDDRPNATVLTLPVPTKT